MTQTLFPLHESFTAVAVYAGERIDVRSLARRTGAPVILPVESDRGWAVLFRYGVIVFFGVDSAARAEFLHDLASKITQPYPEPEVEQLNIFLDPEAEESFSSNGTLSLKNASLERVQLLAAALAKSVVLAQYEEAVATVFADIEPLADNLRRTGRGLQRAKALLQQIGGTLMIQHKMVGRVEVTEKPELLWEKPEFDRLYQLFADEYELRERHTALERKLGVVSDTAETLLELLQAKRSLRVEWYIVILIVVEIAITIYTKWIE